MDRPPQHTSQIREVPDRSTPTMMLVRGLATAVTAGAGVARVVLCGIAWEATERDVATWVKEVTGTSPARVHLALVDASSTGCAYVVWARLDKSARD